MQLCTIQRKSTTGYSVMSLLIRSVWYVSEIAFDVQVNLVGQFSVFSVATDWIRPEQKDHKPINATPLSSTIVSCYQVSMILLGFKTNLCSTIVHRLNGDEAYRLMNYIIRLLNNTLHAVNQKAFKTYDNFSIESFRITIHSKRYEILTVIWNFSRKITVASYLLIYLKWIKQPSTAYRQ